MHIGLVTVAHFYGMTEINALCAMSFDVKHLGEVGPQVTLKLVDPETGKLCGTHEVYSQISDQIYYSF